MTRLLASVTDLEEARSAYHAGVDLIDLKNPADGALGALAPSTIETIRNVLPDHPISATIGDLPLHPEMITDAVARIAATGADYVKIGLFPGGDLEGTLTALRPLAQKHALIGVLFADYLISLQVIDVLADAGFAGVMLDTAGKDKGSLTRMRPPTFLDRFVYCARSGDLLVGLAGSLGLDDIPQLLELDPDYLGFRGALCHRKLRTHQLDPERLADIRKAIPELHSTPATDNGLASASP
ncbi:(5-formylfuran-3-yl)methyl phosphate synthase [Methylohalobius crimeensis]|uniref:(5-formylfuran-3-yl)methyl phosphate synthase n=1 Tax=Methylohalobius crimeensis TaxID=244365 RepID=UPI0003B3AFB4|nr:(5-formylfuran-3-yl)methyl phosphate synthase [Methylohalobius crimeensis]